MWQEFTPAGYLRCPNFLKPVTQLRPMYVMGSLGGTMYLVGFIMMTYNLIKTIKVGNLLENEDAEAPALTKVYVGHAKDHWHRWIERRPIQLMLVALVVILIGGLVEMVPTFLIKSNIPTISSVKPYSPLELQGRDI